MIIVIICTLLRSYPPDSSPLRNSPVILPAWLPPFSLFLSSFLFLSRSIPAVVPSCVMLRSSLLYSPSRHADLFPSPIVNSILPHPRSPCVDLSPLPLADELRGNEREQGRSNRPSTETVFLSRPFRLSSCIRVVLPAILPLSCGRPENFTMRNAIPASHFSARSFSISLCFSLYFSCGCARAHFFPWFSLPLSLVAPPPQQLSARGSFQLVPAETFHRPPFSAFFPSGFFSPPRTFLARLISRLFFSERKSRVKIAGPYALNTATCDQYRMTRVTLSRDRLYRT